eukprot:3781398-Amphidinium_carterae.1
MIKTFLNLLEQRYGSLHAAWAEGFGKVQMHMYLSVVSSCHRSVLSASDIILCCDIALQDPLDSIDRQELKLACSALGFQGNAEKLFRFACSAHVCIGMLCLVDLWSSIWSGIFVCEHSSRSGLIVEEVSPATERGSLSQA